MIKCVFEVPTKRNLETMRNLNRITKKYQRCLGRYFQKQDFVTKKATPWATMVIC